MSVHGNHNSELHSRLFRREFRDHAYVLGYNNGYRDIVVGLHGKSTWKASEPYVERRHNFTAQQIRNIDRNARYVKKCI